LIDAADKRLVRLIRTVSSKLTPKEIGDSIRRLDIRIEPPADLPDAVRTSTGGRIVDEAILTESKSAAAKRAWETRRSKAKSDSHAVGTSDKPAKGKKSRTSIPTTLAEIIGAGFLKPPLKLFRKYKGTRLNATLKTDGTVEFQGTAYPSCSTAAEFARGTITGRRMNTNGWDFWQFADSSGKTHTLADTRNAYIEYAAKRSEK
jgi:hypothetical protein